MNDGVGRLCLYSGAEAPMYQPLSVVPVLSLCQNARVYRIPPPFLSRKSLKHPLRGCMVLAVAEKLASATQYSDLLPLLLNFPAAGSFCLGASLSLYPSFSETILLQAE